MKIKNQEPRAGNVRGFSLIELVVTMLIVAILAAVAIPAYSNYVRKSRRTDAKSGLLNLAALEERFFSTQNAYTSDPTQLGYTSFPLTLGSGDYTVAAFVPVVATAGAPASYTITAVPAGDQINDTQCASFTITSTGVQSSVDINNVDSTAVCWK
jgi:type IV pilus assembly protein PilE